MRKIDKIIIAGYKKDHFLTKICIASIRYFYPEIRIYLLKDLKIGKYSTFELEKNWDVKVLDIKQKKFGWGISKLEPYFFKNNDRVLIIDSDIVFTGKLLDQLESYTEDFIISADFIDNPETLWFKRTYYDIEKLKKYDSSFFYPGYVFNTGQIVCTTGLFKRNDFAEFIEYGDYPILKNRDIFSCADQGILNYFLPKLENENRILIRKLDFMIWSSDPNIDSLDLQKIIHDGGYPKLIHWAGGNSPVLKMMNRSDILIFFQDFYYSKVKFGKLKQLFSNKKRDYHYYLMGGLRRLFSPIKRFLK